MATFYFVKVDKLSHYEFNYGNTSQTTFYKKARE